MGRGNFPPDKRTVLAIHGRRMSLRIFPDGVLGRVSTSLTRSGLFALQARLELVTRAFQTSRETSQRAATMYAYADSPVRRLGIATTAASRSAASYLPTVGVRGDSKGYSFGLPRSPL